MFMYHYKSKYFIISILLVFCFFSCKKNDENRYYNQEYSFSIKFPIGWIIMENERDTDVMAVMPDYSQDKVFNENINIVINNFEKVPSLEDYNKQQIAGIKKIKNMKVLSEGAGVIDQNQTRWFIYSYLLNGFGVKAKVFTFIKKNRSFLITCIFDKDNFDHYESLMDATILTFRFEGGSDI